MKRLRFFPCLVLISLLTACSGDDLEKKGFQVTPDPEDVPEEQANGLKGDSLKFDTRPSSVLLTGVSTVRLTTVYKVNLDKRDRSFIGSNNFHYSYDNGEENSGNAWHNNLMPGLSAVYGYNMVNISHYDIKENKPKNFFESPVLIRTLYYPSFSKDTLQHNPVHREFFMVSVYDEDTNKDGFINLRDLRRFYLFNLNGEKQKALVPENYAVFKSEYDPDNDFMYVFAQLDSNNNGQQDEGEAVHVFWINLKDPTQTGRQY